MPTTNRVARVDDKRTLKTPKEPFATAELELMVEELEHILALTPSIPIPPPVRFY